MFVFVFVKYVPKSPSTAKVISLLSPEAGIVSNSKIPVRIVKLINTMLINHSKYVIITSNC